MKQFKIFKAIAVLLTALNSAQAQEPELVANINALATSYLPSFTQEMTVASGKVFFAFNQDGYDMAVYDGETLETFDGPLSVKDFTAVGERVYFSARRNDIGTELWMYENGEITEIDINVGSGDSSPTELTALNGTLYFQANNGANGKELWKHDGTTATLIDIVDGAIGSEPIWLTTYNNELVFFANDATIGFELYKYDGTDVTLIDDINSGASGSVLASSNRNPHFQEFDGSLYFRAYDGVFRLFKYDGTDVTNQNLRINGSAPQYITAFNSKLYFYGIIDSESGQELIEFDGTSATVIDINPGSNSSLITPQTRDLKFAKTSTHLYFEATDGVNSFDLYSYDGTSFTRLPSNTDNSDLSGNSFSAYLGVANDKLYFQGYGGADTGVELWEHDGTNLTEIVIRSGEESSSVRHMADLNGDLYFTANYGDETKDWLVWKYDGTNPSFISYKGTTEPGDPYYFVTAGDNVYFSANDGIHGYELWTTDGTTTELVADQYPGSNNSYNYAMRGIGDKVFYFGSTDDDDLMYVYDGNTFETYNFYGDDDGAFIEFNGDVYFQGWTSELGGELYKYDDTGVSLVADIREGSNGSSPRFFFVWNSELYFSAAGATGGRELWKYDGTSASMVADINPSGSSNPYGFTPVGNNLYFIATTSDEGQEVARYDGTSVTIIDIYEGATTSSPGSLIEYKGKLVLEAKSDVFGTELIIIDDENNVEVLDINTSGDSYPDHFFKFKNVLYFRASTDATGSDLFSYDGTNVTSHDLVAGAANAYPYAFFELGPYMYFSAQSGENPYGMHRYDGVGEIEFISSISPNFESDYEDLNFTTLDNYAYFNGDDEAGDYELYRIRRIEDGNDILSFSIADQLADAVIDSENHTITVGVRSEVDLTSLSPMITISDQAEINAPDNPDFSIPVVYEVWSEYGELQEWTVTVEVVLRTDTDILTFSLPEQTGQATIDAVNHTVTIEVEVGTNATSLTPTITLSTGAGASPNSEVAQDFTNAVTYTVTAEDEITSQDWTVTVTVESPLSATNFDKITAFPNPVKEQLTIKGLTRSGSYRIVDVQGKVQLAGELQSSVDFNGLKKGLYFLEMDFVDGSGKVIKILKTN